MKEFLPTIYILHRVHQGAENRGGREFTVFGGSAMHHIDLQALEVYQNDLA